MNLVATLSHLNFRLRTGLSVAFVETKNPLTQQIATVLEKHRDGRRARTHSSVVGKSGVRHSFSFTLDDPSGPVLVGDVCVGESDIDETKVLSLFIKFYDVGSKTAILCVSPRLSDQAVRLARLYNILVVEATDPATLSAKLDHL